MIGHERLLSLAEEDRGKPVRRVYIPLQEEHQGMYGVEVAVPWICPICDGPRGEPTPGLSYDGSRRLGVHTWTNACGHVDKFVSVRAEAKQHLAEEMAAERELEETPPPEEPLTPCPFCEAIDVETHTDGLKDGFPACVVVCGACGARGARREATTVREAARFARASWSAVPRKQQAFVATLESTGEQLTAQVAQLQEELAKHPADDGRQLIGSVYFVDGLLGWETAHDPIMSMPTLKRAKEVAAAARDMAKAIVTGWECGKSLRGLSQPASTKQEIKTDAT